VACAHQSGQRFYFLSQETGCLPFCWHCQRWQLDLQRVFRLGIPLRIKKFPSLERSALWQAYCYYLVRMLGTTTAAPAIRVSKTDDVEVTASHLKNSVLNTKETYR
jgi:hypothetical protein